ncbi:MAG: hypothetical protein H7X95_05340 [Deltaproteobacteria bacterium]|nr:hypothetical protein [Deltaproteobacteria bacterium]
MVSKLLYWTIWATFPSYFAYLGCVVPIAPDFQNPPSAPNHYPYFSNTEPIQERTVTIPPGTAGGAFPFVASVGDQNLGDTLYVRWVADYPPFAPNISKVLSDSQDGVGLPIPPSTPPGELRPDIPLQLRCESFAPGMQQHRLVVIVSDRPFLKAGTFSGDLRYNRVETRADQSPVTYPIMAGWNVICPP